MAQLVERPFHIEEPDRHRYRLTAMRRTLAAACGLAILIGACTSTTSSDDGTQKESTQAKYTVDTANSKPAQLGLPYRFVVATHCGIDWAIDFDGTFWGPAPEDARAYRRGNLDLRQPSDRGTMTLLSDARAEYRSKSGSVITYQRAETTRPDTACF